MAAHSSRSGCDPTGRPCFAPGVAALLAACSPMLVVLGQEARPYPLLTFAYACAILALLRLMRRVRDRRTGQVVIVDSSPARRRVRAVVARPRRALRRMPRAGAAPGLAWTPRDRAARIVRGLDRRALSPLLYAPCLLMMPAGPATGAPAGSAGSRCMLLQLVGALFGAVRGADRRLRGRGACHDSAGQARHPGRRRDARLERRPRAAPAMAWARRCSPPLISTIVRAGVPRPHAVAARWSRPIC